MSVNVYKTYLLSDDSDIDIMSTDDLVITQGSSRSTQSSFGFPR